jgi:hypothetical protein
MRQALPILIYEDLVPTRDYLREAALVLSSLQRGFLPKHPRQWQYGLEVSMRGLSTQPFTVAGEPTCGGLDLVRHKLRLGGSKWALHEYAAPEIFNNIKVWLETRGLTVKLPEPTFASGVMLYDTAQAEAYAAALWWLDEQFRQLKSGLGEGVTSPILLYPHHFDLALAWFPFDDERQLSVGWSTGDGTIHEPYIYLNAYPEPVGFTDIELLPGAYWQQSGFSAAILPYALLQGSDNPAELFRQFAAVTLSAAQSLFS